MKYTCLCCGYLTLPLPAKEAVAYICPVCFWENDVFIHSDNEPSDENHGLSLNEGRRNFREFGACQREMIEYIRKPLSEEKRIIMQSIIFIGVQACGKSSYYKQNFADSHIRLNLDMLKTRNRERILLDACIQAKQNFVVDNTNLCRLDREKYINDAKKAGFKIIGYYFKSNIENALERNRNRPGNLPDKAILCAYNNLELPDYTEGFDELYYIKIVDGNFQTEEWKYEI